MKQHIHILGICGTFMGSLAQLAKAAGYRVTGCDAGVYPPMSTQLESAGIELTEGFSEDQLSLKPDVYVIGNVVSRGNPLMEAILDAGVPFVSGPQWFADHILAGRWVLGVSGTHGKTTTTSMLAWILEYAGFKPGYLVGGVPENFGVSARLGESDFFVVEADEYDTAFFDKRSKFVHYKPRTLIINNLEFDHADIFPDLESIKTQFHHVVRTVARNGLVIAPSECDDITDVLDRGCWSDIQRTGLSSDSAWSVQIIDEAKNHFSVLFQGEHVADVQWALTGKHNIQNALHAIAAARHIGIWPEVAAEALACFDGVKRRMEQVDVVDGVTVYDDFAHHPTAIETTLEGLRKKVGTSPIVAVIEPRSNTMKLGVHRDALLASAALADQVHWYQDDGLSWSLEECVQREDGSSYVYQTHEDLLKGIIAKCPEGSHVVVMSNGGFAGVPRKLVAALSANIEQ